MFGLKKAILGSVTLVAACLHGATVDLATAGDLSLTALDDTATYTNTGSELRTLKLTAADPVFDEEKVVFELADAGAKIDVAAGGTLRVADFYIDGVRQKPGYYDTTKDARLVGAGRIRVPGIGTMMIFR